MKMRKIMIGMLIVLWLLLAGPVCVSAEEVQVVPARGLGKADEEVP